MVLEGSPLGVRLEYKPGSREHIRPMGRKRGRYRMWVLLCTRPGTARLVMSARQGCGHYTLHLPLFLGTMAV